MKTCIHAPRPVVKLACNISYLNGVSHCRTCGREWPGNRPRECQAKKPLRLVRSSLYEPGEVAKLIGVKGCG